VHGSALPVTVCGQGAWWLYRHPLPCPIPTTSVTLSEFVSHRCMSSAIDVISSIDRAGKPNTSSRGRWCVLAHYRRWHSQLHDSRHAEKKTTASEL